MRAFLACFGFGPREVARCSATGATCRTEQSSLQNGHGAVEGVGVEPVAATTCGVVNVFIETTTPATVSSPSRRYSCTDSRAGSRPELVALCNNAHQSRCQDTPRRLSPSPERNEQVLRGEISAPGGLDARASAPAAHNATPGVKLTTLDQLLGQVDESIWVAQGAHGAVARAQWRSGCTVAVKWIVTDAMQAPAAYLEAMVAKMLAHPHLVQCFDYSVCRLQSSDLDPTTSNSPGRSAQEAPASSNPAAPSILTGGAAIMPTTSDPNRSPVSGRLLDDGLASALTGVDPPLQPMPTADSFDLGDGRQADPLGARQPVSGLAVLRSLGASPGKYVVQLVSEWCDEGTLHGAIRRGVFRAGGQRSRAWALRALLRTAREVSLGMFHLHTLNIIHGDLKPTNVLLKSSRFDSRGFMAKVGDFGLSRLCGPEGYVSTAEWGTVPYMAGEYLDNRLMKSSDVYSFGVLLWQMYTGRAPFAGHHEAQVAFGVMTGDLSLEWPDNMPPPLARLGQACCRHKQEDRPTFKEVVVALVGMEEQVRDARASCKARRSLSLQQRAASSSHDPHPAAVSSAAFDPAAAPARATVPHVPSGHVGGDGGVTWDLGGASGGSELGAQHLALQEQLLRQMEHSHHTDWQQMQPGQTPCGQQQQQPQRQQVLQRWTELEQQRGQLQQPQQGSHTDLSLDCSWQQPGGLGSSSSRMLPGRLAVPAPPPPAKVGYAHAWPGSAPAAAATAGAAAAPGAVAVPVAASAAALLSGDRDLSRGHRLVDYVGHAVHTNAVRMAEGGGADGGARDETQPSLPGGSLGAVAASHGFISRVPSSTLDAPFVPLLHQAELYAASPFTGPGYSYVLPSGQACLHYMGPHTGGAGPTAMEEPAAGQQQQRQLALLQSMGLSCGGPEVPVVGSMLAHTHGVSGSAPFVEPPSSSYGSCALPLGTGVVPFAFSMSHVPIGSCTGVSNGPVALSNRWSLGGALAMPSGPCSAGSLPPYHVIQQQPFATGGGAPSPPHNSAAFPSLPFLGSGPARGMSLPTTLPSSVAHRCVGSNMLPLSSSGVCAVCDPAAGPAFAPVPYSSGGVVFPPYPRPQDPCAISSYAGPGAPLDHGLLRAGSMPGDPLASPGADGAFVRVPAAPGGEQYALRSEQFAGQAVQRRGSDGGGAVGCGAGGKLPSAALRSPARPAPRPPLPVPYRGLVSHGGGVYGCAAVGTAAEGSCRRGSLGRQAVLQHVPEDDGDQFFGGGQPLSVGRVANEE